MKIELSNVKQSSEPSKIHSTGGVLADLLNKTDLTASKPDLLSMLENTLLISKVTKTALAFKKHLKTINIINYIKQMAAVLNSGWLTF